MLVAPYLAAEVGHSDLSGYIKLAISNDRPGRAESELDNLSFYIRYKFCSSDRHACASESRGEEGLKEIYKRDAS